ncbi:MAG: radical SAM protein [Candidatus Alcyoniella australis]|nr:radical SAM protein [Candidatus Alcyoniella australis]
MSRPNVVFVHAAFEHLGVELLSAYLKQHDVETSLAFDPRMFDDSFVDVRFLAKLFDIRERLADQVAQREPDLVAFSVLAADYRWALDMAARIKRRCSAPVVFGGIHATSAPEALLENEQVDYCIVGEGERALLELTRALHQGSDPTGVDNLCFRADGAVRCNPLGPLIQDLDALPFADKQLFYDQVPGYARHYTLLTRRGCINRCSYCHNTIWRRLYPDQPLIRLRSVDNVFQELTAAKARYGFNRLRINDDLFSYNREWLLEFCKRYPHEVGVPFMCFCSPLDLDAESVAALKNAGCFQVCVGVQDVHEQVRAEVFDRRTPQAALVRSLACLRKQRLRATVDNILGFPGQTEQQIQDVAQFYLDNPVYGRFTVFWLIYYAGTAITEAAHQRGELSDEQLAQLQRDPPRRANTMVRSGSLSRRLTKLHLFLVLIQWLPRSWSRLMLHKQLYRLLPPINPSLIEGLWTVFTRDRLDPIRRRYYIKYLHYGLRRFISR